MTGAEVLKRTNFQEFKNEKKSNVKNFNRAKNRISNFSKSEFQIRCLRKNIQKRAKIIKLMSKFLSYKWFKNF